MNKSWTVGVPVARALVLGLLLSGLASAHAPRTYATSLEQSVATTLESNPEIGIVGANRQAIDQELRQARAQYFPSLDARAAGGPEYTNSPATRNRDGSETLLRLESQLTLSQRLFDGYSTESEVERQLARIDSAARRVRETAEFVGLDAIEAHLDILRNQSLVALAVQNVEEHQRIADQVGRLEREGAGSIADVTQADARLAAAQSALATARGNLRDAEAAYLAVVGIPPAELEEPLVPVVAVPESAEAAAAKASAENPTVRIADADIEVAKAELEGSRSGYYPRLDLELGAGANRNLDGIEGSDVDAQALLVMRYNLFRGGADVAREREAFFRVSEARQELARVRREAVEDALVSYSALLTARDRVQALRDQAEATRATRNAYAQQFDIGQRSLLDLLDAENELFAARSNLVTAEYTEMFAVYRVLAVIGDLLMVLDIDAPKESIDIWRQPAEDIYERPVSDDQAAASPAAARSRIAADLRDPSSRGGSARAFAPGPRPSADPARWQGFLDALTERGAAFDSRDAAGASSDR
jgi:outer membrane protein, adhesin transport system